MFGRGFCRHVIRKRNAGGARVYGIDRPRIALDAPANLVLIDENASWTVSERGFRSRSVNSWLLGKTLRGRVKATIADGRLVWDPAAR